jgi:hypothetical protein
MLEINDNMSGYSLEIIDALLILVYNLGEEINKRKETGENKAKLLSIRYWGRK